MGKRVPIYGLFEAHLTVVATTRNKNKIDALRNNGADYVIIDNGQIASEAKQLLS
jgi:NADPH:quinone reductase-like Zn-dependent oxidoreductase